MEADCLYLLALCSLPSLVQDCGAFSFAFVTQQNRLPKLMPFSPASSAKVVGRTPGASQEHEAWLWLQIQVLLQERILSQGLF